MKSRLLVAVCVCIFTIAVSSAHAVSYSITDLGTLGGGASLGYDVNNNGQVTGTSIPVNSPALNHAFLSDGTTMQDLGTLGGTESLGLGINNSGQVTGGSDITGDVIQRAFLYDGTTMQDIGTLGGYSAGSDINDSGQVTGSSDINANPVSPLYHAFLYDGTSMKDIGTLGGAQSFGKSINKYGHVTGSSSTVNANRHAFIYDGTTIQDIGTLGGSKSSGEGINDSGQVAGTSEITVGSYVQHAFMYDGITMQDLGTLSGFTYSVGRDINNSGQVVGYSDIDYGYGGPNITARAYLYDSNSMLDLCVLLDCTANGWDYLNDADGISDRGDITGTGYINGERHAYLITAVPIPPALLLFGSSVLGLTIVAKHKKG